MARQSQPIDSRTKETLKQLHADYKTATSNAEQYEVAGKALNVLAPKTDPKPPSED